MKYFILAITAFLMFQCGRKNNNKGTENEVKTRRPNVLLITTDQWRAQAMGYAGNSDVQTPNLDKLSHESLVFNNAISGLPSCSPYRASLITGQYWLTHGVFYNDKPLDPDAITLGDVYKNAGYNTGYIGKWHLNGDPELDPVITRNEPVPKERRQGFDYWKVNEVTHKYNSSFYFDENNVKRKWRGYDVFAQTEDAIAYMEKKSDEENPFFLFLSFGPPHDPYNSAPEKYRELYRDHSRLNLRPNVPDSLRRRAKRALAGYYAHIAALDESIGHILRALNKLNIDENTILVFTSDHGDMMFSHGEQKKQQPWDESVKVPFILRYPSRLGTKPGKITMPFNAPDIMPTLLSLSGIPIPASVEGRDYAPYLTETKPEEDKPALLISVMPYHNWSPVKGGREYRGVRTKRYTYVRDLQGPWLLYDNEKDPFQMNNLVKKDSHKDIQQHLEKELSIILERNGDEFLPGDYYMKKWGYSYDPQDQ